MQLYVDHFPTDTPPLVNEYACLACLQKRIASNEMAEVVIKCSSAVCVETWDSFRALSRFLLRDRGTTLAMGKIVSVP